MFDRELYLKCMDNWGYFQIPLKISSSRYNEMKYLCKKYRLITDDDNLNINMFINNAIDRHIDENKDMLDSLDLLDDDLEDEGDLFNE